MFLLISTLCGGVAIFYRWLAGMTIAGRHLSAWSSYAAPHVWLFAICLVYFFATRVHLPMWLARFVSVISPSMFGVYLLHDTTSFGRLLYRVPQSWLDHVGLHPFLCVLLSTLLCFLICLSIDLLRRMILGLIWKRIDHLLPT